MIPVEKSMSVTGVAVPLVDVDEALRLWKAFETFKQKMLVPWGHKGTDYQRIKVSERQPDGAWKTVDKDFPKKSAARKFAKFFGISDRILEKVRVDREDGSFVWHYTVEAWAPNGQIVTAEGVCDSNEKKSKKLEHDVKTTAHTRAKSRAVFDLVGGGEVSAEEVTLGGYTSDKEVIEADYEVKEPEEPERAKGIGPPPKPRASTTLESHVRETLPSGVESVAELEGLIQGKYPMAVDVFTVFEDADGFSVETGQIEEDLAYECTLFFTALGGDRMDAPNKLGYVWTVPRRERDG